MSTLMTVTPASPSPAAPSSAPSGAPPPPSPTPLSPDQLQLTTPTTDTSAPAPAPTAFKALAEHVLSGFQRLIAWLGSVLGLDPAPASSAQPAAPSSPTTPPAAETSAASGSPPRGYIQVPGGFIPPPPPPPPDPGQGTVAPSPVPVAPAPTAPPAGQPMVPSPAPSISASTGTAASEGLDPAIAAQAEQVLADTNAQRAAYGLPPLSFTPALDAVAAGRSEDMVKRNYFSHVDPDGHDPFWHMQQGGVSFMAAGENIAEGQPTPDAVVQAWMNSPGHRANILNPNYHHIGIGIAQAANGMLVWTQDFTN